jgi:hypothetical protein
MAQAPLLRPLGVGDVLDKTFNVYRTKPLVFIGLSALWYLLFFLIFIVLIVVAFAGTLATIASQATRTTTPTISPDLFAGLIVSVIAFVLVAVAVAIFIFSAQSASLVYAGSARYLGKTVTIGEAFRAGVGATFRLFIAALLVFLAIVGVWGVLFILAALTNQFIAFGLAFLVAIIATFYLGASWLVAPVVVVLEKMGPVAALGRAWRLSEGNRWRIVGIQVLLLILNLILSVLIGSLFAVGGQSDQPGVGNVIQSLVNLASTIVWAPVEWIAFTVLYYDLRVRKEAFDLQLAAEALPQS